MSTATGDAAETTGIPGRAAEAGRTASHREGNSGEDATLSDQKQGQR